MFGAAANFLEGRHFQRQRTDFLFNLIEKNPATGDLCVRKSNRANPIMEWVATNRPSSTNLDRLSAFGPSKPTVMDSHVMALACWRILFRMSNKRPSPKYNLREKVSIGANLGAPYQIWRVYAIFRLRKWQCWRATRSNQMALPRRITPNHGSAQ